MVTPLVETTETTLDTRIYTTDDDDVTISGDVAAVPVGWVEMGENSDFSLEGTGATADGQIRADRGHARPVVVNKSHTITFSLKPQTGVDPVQDYELDVGAIRKFLKVGDDGYYVMVLAQITRVRESAALSALPAWEGTAEVRSHPTRGKVTTWPPAIGP